MLGVGLACLVVGIGLSPVLAYLLPSSIGTRVASFIVGEKDRWNSGAMMMAVSNPEGWQRVREDSQLVEANRDRITACQKAVSGQEKLRNPVSSLFRQSRNSFQEIKADRSAVQAPLRAEQLLYQRTSGPPLPGGVRWRMRCMIYFSKVWNFTHESR
ncbi:DUF6118 family protein [Komagataeibacter rhaeticus]|nr:DUF6118 family protein [Komagataeibacter rhaeticus]